MSNQSPRPAGSKRAPLYAIIIALVVLAIYVLNVTGMGVLLPEQYNVDLTAEATRVAEATQIAASATDEAASAAGAETAAPEDTAAAPAADTSTEAPPVEPTPTEAPAPTATEAPTSTPLPQPTATSAFPARINGLPTIAYDDLPPEAQETIQLIDEGGPFPFDRDGITFQNREGLLPDEPRGYYSEYTVITPGSSNRGARRIVAGENGELYYTDDHYESFSYVVR